jgi:hypothetical protein
MYVTYARCPKLRQSSNIRRRGEKRKITRISCGEKVVKKKEKVSKDGLPADWYSVRPGQWRAMHEYFLRTSP